MSRYSFTLGSKLNDVFLGMCRSLDLTREEVIRRALTLFVHAVKADEVVLVKDGHEQTVLIK